MHLHTLILFRICSYVFCISVQYLRCSNTAWNLVSPEEIVLYLPQEILFLPSGLVKTQYEFIVFFF